MVAVKSPHKIEYIGFSERTQNILFELSILNPIYLECLHFGLNPAFEAMLPRISSACPLVSCYFLTLI